MAQDGSPLRQRDGSESEAQHIENPQTLNAEMAKAFQELARGEKTASALESRLDSIESRIEQLLASVEQSARERDDEQTGNVNSQSSTTKGTK